MVEKYLKNKTILAIASIAIGVFMVIKRGSMAVDIVRVIGYILMGAGVVYAVSYFTGNRDSVQLTYAGLAGIGGLLIVLLASRIIYAFPVLAGAFLVLNGLINLTQTEGSPAYSRGTAILLILLGILIIIFKYTVINAVVVLMGIALILNGLSELDIIRRY